jgi:hypothetical protein
MKIATSSPSTNQSSLLRGYFTSKVAIAHSGNILCQRQFALLNYLSFSVRAKKYGYKWLFSWLAFPARFLPVIV